MDTVTLSPAEPTSLTARQIAPTFAAELRGIPIRGDLGPEQLTQFVSLLHRYRVLVVPEANVAPADLVAFSRRFGPLEIHSRFDNTLPKHREIFCVGNVERDGMKASFSRGVEQWHADSSYREIPSDASLFYGEIVPVDGGETWFADATAAWRTLDTALQTQIESLRAVHSLETLRQWNQSHNPDRPMDTQEQVARFPPVAQPLVRTHPATGARSIYVCPAVISHVEGMDPAEGADLIKQLICHASQPRFVYRHRWHRGDLVIWDNRAVLHTASLFDHMKYQRLMYRTTLAGNAPLLAA
jgi:alpha-ketoglutarate-dependent taurine dioxygenase